jgi:predicted kinase
VTVEVPLVVLAGAAGTGKTTAGRRLARRLRGALLDLDTLTAPLSEALLERATGDRHGYGSRFGREELRPLRYATLTAAALEVLGCGVPVVAVAPWTRELADPDWHIRLTRQAQERGGRLLVAWLHAPAEVRRARLAARGALRDAAAEPERAAVTVPLVPHLALDATQPGRVLDGRLAALLDG